MGLITMALGCSPAERSQVTGQVLYSDGKPLVGATVTARSNRTGKWASGATNKDGQYELGTATAGEGVPPGDYYVIISEDRGDLGQRHATIPKKYEKASGSGLRLSVEPGKNTVLDIKLDAS